MAEQILVPLKRHDQIEEIIPYLKKISKRMKVTFLFPSTTSLFDGFDDWLEDQRRTCGPGIQTPLEARKMMQMYSEKKQKELTEQKVSSVQEALGNGVGVDVDFYESSLRRALRDYSPDGDGQLSIIRAARAHPITKLLHFLFAVLMLGILGLSAVPTGAVERPTPDDQTTIVDPSGTDAR